jgi:hypothetical protein
VEWKDGLDSLFWLVAAFILPKPTPVRGVSALDLLCLAVHHLGAVHDAVIFSERVWIEIVSNGRNLSNNVRRHCPGNIFLLLHTNR